MDGNRPVGLISLNAGSTLVRAAGERVADHMIALDRAPTLNPDQAASDALVELAEGKAARAGLETDEIGPAASRE